MEPLRIRCRPLVLFHDTDYDPWLKLDSLLARAALLDHLREGYYALPQVDPATPAGALLPVDLPLARRERNGVWYWACSWANVSRAALAQYESAWVRTFPVTEVSWYAGQRKRLLVKTWQGPEKLYNMPIYPVVVDELAWYAVGDRAEIERLLVENFDAIGKKTAYGHGQLSEYPDGRKWLVEPWPADWSERDGEGRLTRGVPAVEMDQPVDLRFYAVRPPYYVLANRAWLEMPG